MRNWIAILLLLPMCMLTMISGVAESSPAETTTPTSEVILVPTNPTEEEIIETTTEEATEATETVEETESETQATEVTEPAATEDDGLISIGTFKLTAYCGCRKCCGKYADNRPVDENGNVIVTGSIGVRLYAGISIAVDPRVIPYNTQVVINGHTYTAHDTGGNIKGNRIDVYFDNHEDAWDFGTQYAEVFIYA